MNFAKFFRTSFSQYTSGRLFLYLAEINVFVLIIFKVLRECNLIYESQIDNIRENIFLYIKELLWMAASKEHYVDFQRAISNSQRELTKQNVTLERIQLTFV